MNKDLIAGTVMPLVTGLTAVWFAFAAASLTWTILEDGSSPQSMGAVAVVVSQQSEESSVTRLSDITQYHLFGREPEGGKLQASKREAVTAPKTRLNLVLRGLFAAENGAYALISTGKGEEQIYKVGMKVNPSTKIDAIRVDSVVLDRGGRLEVLYLEGADQPQKVDKSQRGTQPMSRRSGNIGFQNSRAGVSGRKLGEQRARLLKNPQEAMRIARIQPVMKQGKLSGYRVNPGSDPKLFNELGFKAGDLVKEINGIKVDDPTKIGTLMTQLTSANQLSVTVERRGRIENLFIEFNE